MTCPSTSTRKRSISLWSIHAYGEIMAELRELEMKISEEMAALEEMLGL